MVQKTLELMTNHQLYKKMMTNRGEGGYHWMDKRKQELLNKKIKFATEIEKVFDTMLYDKDTLCGSNTFTTEIRASFESFITHTIDMIDRNVWEKEVSHEVPFMCFGVASNKDEFRYGVDDTLPSTSNNIQVTSIPTLPFSSVKVKKDGAQDRQFMDKQKKMLLSSGFQRPALDEEYQRTSFFEEH